MLELHNLYISKTFLLSMDKDVDRIPKNPDTDIVIRIDDFGGKRGVTIREFVRGERYTGFTKAGTRIPVEHFKTFKAAINSISEKELMEGLDELAPNDNSVDYKKDKKITDKKKKVEEDIEEDFDG